MKILHIIPAIASRYGGPSAVVLGLCRALAQLGLDISIATTSADGRGDLRVPLGVPVEYEGVRTIFFHRTFSEAYKYSGDLGRWLMSNVATYDLAHVHAVFSHSSITAARACRRHAVPYVLRPLGSLYPWALAYHPLQKRLFLALMGGRVLTSAAAVHYSSEDEKRFAEMRFAMPPGFVTSLGVDDDMFRDVLVDPHGHGSGPYILFMGRLHAVKRLEWLISAFAGAMVDGWRLIIAGEGSVGYRRELEDFAHAHGIREVIEFAGWASGEEKRRLLSGAAVAALVSSQENFGMSAAEAMAAGVPVVVAPEVGLSADVAAAGAGWVVSDGDLEGALRAAMASAEERRRRGDAAAEWARRHYRWDSVARRVMSEYRTTTGRA